MIVMYILLYGILVLVIRSYETLRCYSCQEEKQCGRMFTSNLREKKIVYGNNALDSCAISVNENGLISRDVIPSRTCRSSSSRFCCQQDLCNSLPAPPLPALTNLSCAVSVCQINDDQCQESMVYRSSATESCVRIYRERIYKSSQIGCFPHNRTIIPLENEELSCCHSPACNQEHLSSDVAIRCYTCDSRITGLEGCEILNTSSTNVYQSGSSSRSESCAMIIGLAGTDSITGDLYPAFTIRTFIAHCVNQSLGNVTYGGALFQGRIDCCSTSLCNTLPLSTNLTLHITTIDLPNLIVFTVFIFLGIIFILIGLSLSIYRFRLKKYPDHHIPYANGDGTTVLFLPGT